MNYCIYEDEVPNNQTLTLPHHTSGSNNSDLDPSFIDPAAFNLRLQQNSPALDSGQPDTTGLFLPENDPDSHIRIRGIIDRGAFENPFMNCPDHINIQVNYSPLKGAYQAKHEIRLQHHVLIDSTSTAQLSAPTITINPDVFVMSGGTLEMSQTGCNP